METGVATAEYVPPHVEVYPREYYGGHVVYLVDDRWYYQDGPRWVYYQREPEPLVRRRVVIRSAQVVHRAPAVREQSVLHQAPPATRDESRRSAHRRTERD